MIDPNLFHWLVEGECRWRLIGSCNSHLLVDRLLLPGICSIAIITKSKRWHFVETRWNQQKHITCSKKTGTSTPLSPFLGWGIYHFLWADPICGVPWWFLRGLHQGSQIAYWPLRGFKWATRWSTGVQCTDGILEAAPPRLLPPICALLVLKTWMC